MFIRARPLFVLAVAAALHGCSEEGADTGETPSSANSAAAGPANTEKSSLAGPDPNLPRELAATAQALSAHLPLRQQTLGGMVTVSAVEARGTEMVHRIDVPADLDEHMFRQFEAQLPARMCEDSQLRQLLLRGGTQTWVMRDKDGETFTATIERC